MDIREGRCSWTFSKSLRHINKMYSLVTGGQEPEEVVHPCCQSSMLIHLWFHIFDPGLQESTRTEKVICLKITGYTCKHAKQHINNITWRLKYNTNPSCLQPVSLYNWLYINIYLNLKTLNCQIKSFKSVNISLLCCVCQIVSPHSNYDLQ